MREFTEQAALEPLGKPEHAEKAFRALSRAGLILVGLAAVVLLASFLFGPTLRHLARLLVVIPAGLTGAALLGGAAAIRLHRVIARILPRIAFLIFVGAVVSIILAVWGAHAALSMVSHAIVEQDAEAHAARTWFGGELTIHELQVSLLSPKDQAGYNAAVQSGEEVAAPVPAEGPWAMWAYALWPLQFALVRDVMVALGVLSFVGIAASFAVWWERKVAGRIQSRVGPMRVGGWHGWAQSVADGLKLVQKEDIHLSGADRPLFKLAPYLVFIPALSAFIALPFGAAWVFRELDVALLFILAMLGIEVVGVIMGGWASNNKWSVYGAMREAAQMVSYEVPLGLSLLIAIMTAGTLKLSSIGEMQSGGFHTWLAFSNPFIFIASVVYFISSLASCKRAPFDLPEAESELVAGFHTEYSGFRWAVFFFAEYTSMLVVSGLGAILFWGAWHSPLPAAWGQAWLTGEWWQQALHGLLFSGPLWFLAKMLFFLFVQIWLRWTLPRIRLDHVIYACVQVLIPLAMVLLLGNTFWVLLVRETSVVGRAANAAMTLVGAILVLGFVVIMLYGRFNRNRLVGSLAVRHLPGS